MRLFIDKISKWVYNIEKARRTYMDKKYRLREQLCIYTLSVQHKGFDNAHHF